MCVGTPRKMHVVAVRGTKSLGPPPPPPWLRSRDVPLPSRRSEPLAEQSLNTGTMPRLSREIRQRVAKPQRLVPARCKETAIAPANLSLPSPEIDRSEGTQYIEFHVRHHTDEDTYRDTGRRRRIQQEKQSLSRYGGCVPRVRKSCTYWSICVARIGGVGGRIF